MSDEEQQLSNQISIQDLELSLEVYEIQSDQKLQKLQQLFKEKTSLDLRQVFYEERSSLEVKFQNIIGDLTEFLINQQVPSTQKLRKTFYRILQSPLLLLFKVSRFEIFNLRLNAFDIQLEPIDAICELAKQLYKNIDQYVGIQKNVKTEYAGSIYESYDQFLQHAKINLIQDEIFILYSYLRKGSAILKKKIEDKIKIVEIFNIVEEKIIMTVQKNQDVKTLKELSILNYEIYLLENGFDVLCFFLKVPFKNIYKEVFKELEILTTKAKQASNYDMFINIFVKFNQEILNKVRIEKIENSYVDYLENIATTMLELWGCRICQFRQFFSLFKLLFEVHPDQKKLLQISLKHVPNLSKEDISLIRANYRQNVYKKNTQLLSLLKKVSLDDINSELNAIYHQILYNLNFELQTNEKIIEMFTLINGNSSIEGFLFTVQKAFKEWNHTIDFNNPVKYIETQFSLPKNISQTQILESLRLFANLCILQSKDFNKQFQELVNRGTIMKAMTGITKLLLSSQQEMVKFVQSNVICQQLILYAFKFLQNTLQHNSAEWQDLLLLLANSINILTEKERQLQLQTQICKYVESNLENYKLGKCVKILKKVYEFNREVRILSMITDIFMREGGEKSRQTRNFRFFGQSGTKLQKETLTKDECEFLKKYACVKGGIIEVRQPLCFKLSDLQVITNPIQFQKAMDNYYFTLDQNSKRFIQYIVEEWETEKSSQNNFYSELILILIQQYPVCVPILSNIRIKPNENAKENIQFRFVQYLVNRLSGPQAISVKKILASIILTDTIKYRNGRDYVIEEIVPMIAKRLLTLINSANLSAPNVLSLEMYETLAQSLERFKLTDLKIDTIQKSLLKINYEIHISTCEKSITRLSKCFDRIIRVFFRKKEIDIKKKGLEEVYESIIWNEIRTYNRLAGNQPPKAQQKQQPVINEQIMVSPYTLSQEFNNEEYKIKKPSESKMNQPEEVRNIKFEEVLSALPVNEVQSSSLKSFESISANQLKELDLSKMKYDIEFYMGANQLNQLETKQNWIIKQRNRERAITPPAQSIEKSITFVQYYMREMTHPQISDELALKSILSYLRGQIDVSHIWTNPKNLQKLFVPLVLVFDFLTDNAKKAEYVQSLKSESTCWREIVDFTTSNLISSLKSILNLFSQLGYHNLWGENYKNFPSSSNILKALQIKVIDEESFLSIVLKRSLQFGSLNEIKSEIDTLFDSIFKTRPTEQTSLMYKVGIDKNLLNLIMKSLEIKNLSNISFLFHSNFNNLRLYTDQLHQGLKALNMASKTRSYNQYIQLSKQIEDEQFMGPMKLFQENFKFFIKIQREGYNFKKAEQKKLCLQRLTNILKQYAPQQKESICKQCDQMIEQYNEEVEKLQLSIANRVKSFYLVTKLRDLSYQNSISINLINQILREKKASSQQILQQIAKVDIFSLVMTLFRELVRFDNSWDFLSYYQNYNTVDQSFISKEISFCTTRRYSHSMSKVYEKCDLQLDEVIQRCLDQLKLFFSTPEGSLYLVKEKFNYYPAFFVKSFVQSNDQNRSSLVQQIRQSLELGTEALSQHTITIKKGEFITDCISQVRELNKKQLYKKNQLTINYDGQNKTPQQFLQILVTHMINSETLVWTKTKDMQFLTFNKYKTSQATLEEIELLGYFVGYCLYHNISLIKGQQETLPLHSSIIAAFSFNIIDIEDLLYVDFKIWEDVKRILSIEDSKTQNLNFSYIFENTKNLQSERVELIDKGASKKVNNLNRDEFCDAIACHVLFEYVKPQVSRLILGILNVVPKQLLSCQKISQIYPIFYNKQNVSKVIRNYMKKMGIVLPELLFREGKKVQNLKDYQNIEWAVDSLLQNEKLREKVWPNETNIVILTMIGAKPSLKFVDNTLLIEHFEQKPSLSAALAQYL